MRIRLLGLGLTLVTLSIYASSLSAITVLSEIRIDQPADDDSEYFEIRGNPGTSLNGLTYLVIGDGSAAAGTGSGVIEEVTDLTGKSIPSDGFFLAVQSTFEFGPGEPFHGIVDVNDIDLTEPLNFENSDNVTHLLVDGFTGTSGDDLDADDNGMLDPNLPWTNILDAVAFVEVGDPNNPGNEFEYATSLGFPAIGPEGSFVPGQIFRNSATDLWEIGEFSLSDPNAFLDTPGSANAGARCDFDVSGGCGLADINLMFGLGNLVLGVPTTASTEKFDLIDNNTIDDADIAEWLVLTGTENGYSSAFLRGDTDDLDNQFDPNAPTRSVDITDFQNFLVGFTGTAATWEVGNFNGDNEVDITDFSNFFVPNFSASGGGTYGAGQAIPEPSSWTLAIIATAVLALAAYVSRRNQRFR